MVYDHHSRLATLTIHHSPFTIYHLLFTAHYLTALSVISKPLSIIANASRNSGSVIHKGGLVKKVFQRTSVYRPSCRKNFPSSCVSGEVPLNGAIGSRVARSRTSSTIPNRPIFLVAPTEG